MFKIYVKDEHGFFVRVEQDVKREELESKMDEYLEQGYHEVIVLNDLNYVMGKIKEKAKVFKK